MITLSLVEAANHTKTVKHDHVRANLIIGLEKSSPGLVIY